MAKAAQKSSSKYTVRGGKGHMFGEMGARPAKPGVISESQPGKGQMFARGGNGHMFGFTGSKPAKPA